MDKREITVLYEDHKNLIWNRVWLFHKTTKCDIDDLLSEAYEVFMSTVDQWKPSRAKFSQLLHLSLTNHLIQYTQKRAREISIDPSDPFFTNQYKPENKSAMSNFLASLGKEAKSVIQMILSCPDEIGEIVDSEINNKQEQLQNLLRKKGWTYPKIWRAFKEIKSTIRMA